MDTIPILQVEDVQQLDAILNDFLQKSEANLAVVIDKGGTVISQQGDFNIADTTILAALAAGSFAATKELARRIGEIEFSALYHQGKNAHIFMTSIDENNILITIFGEQTTVGLVRFYTVNATSQLAQLLAKLRARSKEEGFQFEAEDIEEVGKIFT